MNSEVCSDEGLNTLLLFLYQGKCAEIRDGKEQNVPIVNIFNRQTFPNLIFIIQNEAVVRSNTLFGLEG